MTKLRGRVQRWRWLLFLGGLTAALSVGCGGETLGPPPAAPGLASMDAAIPNDLDWVVRVDLKRMRDALGPVLVQRIREEAEAAGGEKNSVNLAFSLADTVWIGFRAAERFDLTDNVVVMRGRFNDLELPSGEDWGPETDLGGDWRRRSQRGKLKRFEPRRLYLRGNDTLVFVSAAEIDSVRRQIERGEQDPRVSPPDRGVLAFAGRVNLGKPISDRPWARERPEIRKLLRDAELITGFIDLEAGQARLELDVEYTDAAVAKSAGEQVARLLEAVQALGAPFAELGEGVKAVVVDTHVVLRWRVSLLKLGRLLVAGSGGGPAGDSLDTPPAEAE
ncbi:MAG: hypothetical protein KC766_14505 [Myxococcales bacterium]|nr:hypothetical protein [Myxococcales bacterium]